MCLTLLLPSCFFTKLVRMWTRYRVVEPCSHRPVRHILYFFHDRHFYWDSDCIRCVTVRTIIHALGLLCISERIAQKLQWSTLERSGDYGNPPSLQIWFKQLVLWLCILTIMKVIVAMFLWLLYKPIAIIGTSMFSVFTHHRHLELFIVMVAGPFFLNALQFWIIDSFIKDSSDDNFQKLMQGTPYQ